jgi:hypothetical protein
VPKKEDHFVVQQVGKSWQATCIWCLESSPLCHSKYKATKWQPVHARTEVWEDLDPIAEAAELVALGYDFDE